MRNTSNKKTERYHVYVLETEKLKGTFLEKLLQIHKTQREKSWGGDERKIIKVRLRREKIGGG